MFRQLALTFFYVVGILTALSARADTLDDAIQIVVEQNAVIREAEAKAGIVAAENSWLSRVKLRTTLGYSQKTTSTEAAGLDARGVLTLEIPLGSSGSRKRSAAQATVASKRDAVVAKFLADVSKLREWQQKVQNDKEMHQLKLDKLEYFKQANDAGTIEPQELWKYAEEAKKAEHGAMLSIAKEKMFGEETARIWGGFRWQELRGLL